MSRSLFRVLPEVLEWGVEIGSHGYDGTPHCPQSTRWLRCGNKAGYGTTLLRNHDLVTDLETVNEFGKRGLGFLDRDARHTDDLLAQLA